MPFYTLKYIDHSREPFKVKKSLITLSVAAALTTPLTAGAVEIAGEKLELYGKIHVSIDSSDMDDPNTNNDGMSISSNSSRIGFKGKLPLENGMSVIWQAEQEIRWDDGSTGNFANRNSYLGLASGAHSLRVGIYDSPFKDLAAKWDIFGDSVGERRAVLGASYEDANKLNTRPDNSILYQFKNDALKIQAMYAADPEDKKTGTIDGNERSLISTAVWWDINKLTLSAAYSDWKMHSKMGDGTTLRVAAVYGLGNHRFGAIYEDITPETINQWSRSAYGVNWKWKATSKTDLRAQYIIVGDAENQADTGAARIGLGLFHKLDKKAEVYVAYGATDNDANAKFQAVDGGHGDEVKTVYGGNPSAISLGMVYKF